MTTLSLRQTAVLALLTIFSTASAHAADTLQNLPAPVGFTLTGTGLPDGRFAIYNGDGVYFQNGAGVDAFTEVATGYEGDPSFIAVSPSGATLLLGAGGFGQPYTGNIYEVDVANPQDYTPAALVTNRNHYAAVFLTESLVLIDAGDFIDSELAVLDLNAKSGTPKTVLQKPATEKQTVVDPKPGYSANLAYDAVSGRVYAMDAAARELRYFSATSLINAFNGSTLLDWENDGTLVGTAGDYVGGGASGVTTQGYIVLGGSLGFTGLGMVQVVNPLNGTIVNALDPVGDDGYTSVIVNSFTGATIVQQSGQDFLIEQSELITPPVLPQLPVAGMPGLMALGAALAWGARRRIKG